MLRTTAGIVSERSDFPTSGYVACVYARLPLTNSTNLPSACGILENGNPLENNPNLGAYAYPLGGFTCDLGDPRDIAVFWRSAEHLGERSVCVPVG